MNDRRPPGWYRHPDESCQERWWNGDEWIDDPHGGDEDRPTSDSTSLRGPYRMSNGKILAIVWASSFVVMIVGVLVALLITYGD